MSTVKFEELIDTHVELLKMARLIVQKSGESTVSDLIITTVYQQLVAVYLVKGATAPQQRMAQEAMNLLKNTVKNIRRRDDDNESD